MIVKQRGKNVEGTAYLLYPPNFHPQHEPFSQYVRTISRARDLASAMGPGTVLQRQTIRINKTNVSVKVTDCWTVGSLGVLTRNEVCHVSQRIHVV